MAWPTDRILVYDRSLSFLFELTPDEVTKRERTEELNGTHELELVTSRVLHEGYRLLTVDGTGKWREWVVYKPDEGHENGDHATGTYVCMWSLQYDLTSTVQGNVVQPGMGSDCTSEVAVRDAIGGQSIWTVGTCDVGKVDAGKGCVMVGNNAWARLKQVVATWGGEVDAVITVSSTKVISRTVELRKHLGSTKATRRFDWGEDLTKIHRTPDPGPYFCRVMPFGRGQREYAEDDETEFDWPADVTEEPYSEGDGWVHDANSAYVRDPEAEAVFRTSDGHGGWHYPTKEVKYDEDDPELLLNEATADIHNHTRPSVSYEADVLQFAEAGMDAQGVALGDDVQCVDYGFNPDAALRVQGRVTRMVVNELAPKTDAKLTIGDLGTSFAATLKDLISSSTQGLKQRLNHIEGGGTIAYVESLLESINAEINAQGGYAYVVENEGIITYDIAVDDPLKGYNSKTHTWASRVTQMKGGTIRFANTKNASFSGINDWKWTNVITPDGYLGLAATIAKITTGYIKDANEKNTWNLDEGVLTTTKGYIGGFEINATSIHTKDVAVTSNADNSIALSTADFTRTINGVVRGGLRFAIGDKMGVTGDGMLYAANANISGTVYASAGEIGGFVIDSNSIHTSGYASSSTDSGAMWLSSSTFTRSINGTSRSDLKLAIGGNFGISSSGYLYAANAVISGNITASEGEIGGFTITSNSLYNGKSSLQSLTSGVYVSTSGISVGNGSAYTALASGYLYGGATSSSTHGYVGFNNYWLSTGIYGARLAGRGCIALLTNGAFGIGSYYSFGSDATITVGQTKNFKLVDGISSVSVTVTPKTIAQRWQFVDDYGETRHYTDPVSIMTGVGVNVSVTPSTKSISFTQGIMTTS